METKQRLIDSFSKNSVEVVKVQVHVWKSQTYIDIRVWTQLRPGDGEGAAQPTYKGITLNVDLLGRLKKAIDKAFAEVEINEAEEELDSGPEDGPGEEIPF
jgi:hypothetical protein